MTVYARNYPESDSRSCSSSESVSFTVKQRVVTPTVTLPSIADQTVGNTVTVKGSATTPCYRMSAKVMHNGTTKWLGDLSGASYSKTYTVPEAGQYGVTLYARSYPESDARSGQGVKTVWFNAYDPVRPTVNLNSITGTKKVGGVITVSGTSSTPCYRMAAKVEHDGVRNWLGEVSSSTYSKTYTIPEPGTYTVTLISRSYAESNPRSGTGEDSVTFTVKGESKNLDVPLYQQSEDDTCGPTSAAMIVDYLDGKNSSNDGNGSGREFQIKDYIDESLTEGHMSWNDLAKAINKFHSSGPSYSAERLDNYSVAGFMNLVKHNINNGCPVQALLAVKDEGVLPYGSEGHYVVITGYSGSNLYINDPHNEHCDRYTVSASKILEYIQYRMDEKIADNPYVICPYL